MGHPEKEFRVLMAELTGDQVEIDRAYLASLSHVEPLDLGKALAEVPALTKANDTHCWNLMEQILARSSQHFDRNDVHYEYDGLLATYMCHLDGRTYNVKITPSKD